MEAISSEPRFHPRGGIFAIIPQTDEGSTIILTSSEDVTLSANRLMCAEEVLVVVRSIPITPTIACYYPQETAPQQRGGIKARRKDQNKENMQRKV